MKSKHLLITAALLMLFSFSKAQTPEFIANKVSYMAVSNGKLFLKGGDYKTNTQGLWISDGTTTGTKLLKVLDIRTPYFTEYDGKTYFLAKGAESYAELWLTDGTEIGTRLVKNLKPANDGSAIIMKAFNNKLYFVAMDAEHGKELWVSDGTESGTKLFKDINPGIGDGFGYDGYAIVYKNKMYFSAKDKQNNEELWVTDGTEVGTKLFKDINTEESSYPSNFNIVNGKLYFNARTANEGNELWVSDGTEAGTHLVRDVAPKEEIYGPGKTVEYNGKAYFITHGYQKPYQLWSTDGTEAGTIMVEDSVGNNMVVFNGELYYSKIVSKKVISYNYALHKTKGKPGEGVLVKVISGGNSTDRPLYMVPANGKLYFSCMYDDGGANYVHMDVWETDGTAANTKLVEISPGKLVDANRLVGLKEYNNALYYTDLTSKLYRIGNLNTAVTEIAHSNFDVILFPNPANHQLTIKTDEKLLGSNFAVLSIMGQMVHSGKINSDNTLLEVGDLPSGVYFVQLQSKDGGITSLFIKE
jgi:ELWxxDGT repeat protein